MDDETSAAELIIDLAVAGLLAAAAGWSGASVSGWFAAVCASATALGLGFAILRGVGRAGRRFPLPAFSPLGWDSAVAPVRHDDKVVELFPEASLPTPGELQQRIDRHLEARAAGNATPDTGDVVLLGADASAALRSALGELKRSLR